MSFTPSINPHHLQREISSSTTSDNNNNTDRLLKLPPISAMDDYLPSRTWIPPISSSPDSFSSSSSTPPQPEHWKSPPYKSRHELKRDSCYKSPLLFASTNALLGTPPTTTTTTTTTTTSPIMHQNPLDSPTHTQKSSYFQYTSKAYHTQQHYNRRHSSTSPSLNSNTLTQAAPSRVEHDIEEVVRQCNTLCDNMIQRKSQFVNLQSNSPLSQQDLSSTRPWLDDMIGRANEVLNALLRLRKHQIASEQYRSNQQNNAITSDHQRPDYPLHSEHQQHQSHRSSDAWRSLGPSSNLTSTANSNKQRKRGKRPAFQGRCHSCNISETPEWRRGPDGARTLCNACGLHYAKLARKQQENRGMSSHILGSSSSGLKQMDFHSQHRRLSSTKLTPPADDIIIDKSPTG